ncbi:WXG100 family type VII secretion target [Microlunatus sp. Y2014]|uniref:WXG100 family type VII secretion target n=1 Tax=Microlunatus sp. Y2014 TaxID=3418488 RepID=UPI003DA75E0D
MTTTATTSGNYNLEQGAFAGMPDLVGAAMGPARSWFNFALEWVCGDPEKLVETGQQYRALGQEVSTVATGLRTATDALPAWQGPAANAFRNTMASSVDVVDKVGGFVGQTEEILVAAAEIATEAAEVIWDLVTELVRMLISTLMKALAASTFSLGSSIAAWLATSIGKVAQVVTKVAQVVGKVGGMLQKLAKLLHRLMALIARYREVLTRIEAILRKVKEVVDKLRPLGDRADGLSRGTWQDHKENGGTRTIGAGGSYPAFRVPTDRADVDPADFGAGTPDTPAESISSFTPNRDHGPTYEYQPTYEYAPASERLGEEGSAATSSSVREGSLSGGGSLAGGGTVAAGAQPDVDGGPGAARPDAPGGAAGGRSTGVSTPGSNVNLGSVGSVSVPRGDSFSGSAGGGGSSSGSGSVGGVRSDGYAPRPVSTPGHVSSAVSGIGPVEPRIGSAAAAAGGGQMIPPPVGPGGAPGSGSSTTGQAKSPIKNSRLFEEDAK